MYTVTVSLTREPEATPGRDTDSARLESGKFRPKQRGRTKGRSGQAAASEVDKGLSYKKQVPVPVIGRARRVLTEDYINPQ